MNLTQADGDEKSLRGFPAWMLSDAPDRWFSGANRVYFGAMNAEQKHNVAVHVETSYMADQSSPQEDRYVFAYTITISNHGNTGVKLLNRHWIITDANGKVQEVRGKGVVGQQPYLKPGEQHRYSSGSVMETPVGAMQGEYEMIDDDGERFMAPIAPFSLQVPNAVH